MKNMKKRVVHFSDFPNRNHFFHLLKLALMKSSQILFPEIYLPKQLSVLKCFLIVAFTFTGISTLLSQQKDPDYIKLTKISYTNGEISEAYRLLAILEKKYPENGYILAERGGWQLYGDNDVNTALVTLSKAIKLLPKDDNILTLRGIAFYRKGLVEKAVEDQKAALLINPDPIQYYIKLGGYHYALGDYDSALSVFLKGVEKHPSQAEIYGEAFSAYAKLNNAYGAKELFNKGILVKNMDTGFLRCYLGNFYMRIQLYKEASELYQLAYDVPEPHMYAEDYNNAAISFMKIGNLNKALSFINIACEKDPSKPEYFTNKADIAMNLKDYETVIASASKAISADENNALAHMYMAIGYKWGRNDIAKAEWYENKAKSLNETSKK